MSNNQLKPQDHEQILRYLRKQMTADELGEFEVRLMNDSDLIRETQREEALIAALHECQDALLATDKPSAVLGFREWMFQPLTAAAAVVVLLVSIPMLGLQQTLVRDAAVESLFIASTHYIEGLRNASQSLNIDAEFPLLLNVDAGPNTTAGPFTVTIRNTESGDLVYEATNQVSGGEGYVALLLREPVAGAFEISLVDESNGDTALRYAVNLR